MNPNNYISTEMPRLQNSIIQTFPELFGTMELNLISFDGDSNMVIDIVVYEESQTVMFLSNDEGIN